MDPAFASRASLLAFIVCTAATLAAPEALPALPGYSRSLKYRVAPQGVPDLAALSQALFDPETLDVLVLGDSYAWQAVHVPTLTEAISSATGRSARVLNMAMPGRSEESQLAIAADAFAHRKVHVVAVGWPRAVHTETGPSVWAQRLWVPGEHAAIDLPWMSRAQLYAYGLLAFPRIAAALILGAPAAEPSHGGWAETSANGVRYREWTPPPRPPFDARLGRGEESLEVTGPPLNAYQLAMSRALAATVRRHGARLVALNIPLPTEASGSRLRERQDWRRTLGDDTEIVGVAGSRLFAGVSGADLGLLFARDHLNANGARLYTAAIAPALAEIHAETFKAP